MDLQWYVIGFFYLFILFFVKGTLHIDTISSTKETGLTSFFILTPRQSSLITPVPRYEKATTNLTISIV